MPVPFQPKNFVPRPFAADGNFDVIPDAPGVTGRASYQTGFPQETQRPLREGGIAPNRLDFNGILNLLTAGLFWQQSGGQWTYASGLNYTLPNIVYHAGKLWWCLRENGPESLNGPHEPGTDETYWIELLTALASMAGGGIGGGFNTMTVLTSSQTWTAPVAGTYKVTCIGGGGAGGHGGGTNVGGGGGGQGSETRFGSFLSALGGSGGGGGGSGVPHDAGAGGGGGAGEVSTTYARLAAGQVVAVSVGSGAQRNTLFSPRGQGAQGAGESGGKGGAGNRLGGGGAPGAGSGANGSRSSGVESPLPGRPPTGGSGGINGTGYGGGGGGGAGGDVYGGDCGGSAKDGAERGGEAADGNVSGYGGAGGRGAVILEYYAKEA